MRQINNWKELAKVPCSETHSLDIHEYCGWIIHKESGYISHLSTDTFYGNKFENSTRRLQACGFDVQLTNSDN